MAIVLQLVVITYNHFSGYHELNDFTEFVLRVIRGGFYSMVAGFAIAYPDLFVIRYLNNNFQWNEGAIKRAIIQFSLMLIIAITVSSLLTTFAHWLSKYPQGLRNVLFNNALIYSVVNAFFMSILEAWIYLDESMKEKVRAEKLQQELIAEAASRAKYEAQIKIEEEKNRHSRQLIEQEKRLNQHLEKEIKKRESVTQQLNSSREQLNSILLNLAGAAYRCYLDEQYTMKYISDKIFDISGYHATEFISNNNLSYASIIHPEDRELCRNTILQATDERRHYEFEYRIIHKNGQVVWVNENGKGICNEKGELTFLDGIIIDITLRKEAEFAAAESERNYKELMHFLPQPVFELDLGGNILFNNKAGQEFFGLEDPEKYDKKLSALSFFIDEDVPRVIETIRNTKKAGENSPNEYTVKKPDGTLCPVMIFGSAIIRNDKVVGRRGIIIDISERKRQEYKILQAKEELERINNTLEQNVAERTKQLTEANTQLLKVQKENLQSQFEVLKQQVNPHFLFNSLNVLTSIIKVDADLAEAFTERLSKVYRYVLENKERDLVSLSTELEFLNAYLFLLEIRFMKKLFVDIKIDKANYDYQILPIAIQLIIENAIKHNTFSKAQPLRIEIFVDDKQRLNIINNLSLRETKLVSTGVGLENISRRYALVSDQKPEFLKTEEQFIARLPLLKLEKIESE
jgi:PAS domain S-box-containing protein